MALAPGTRLGVYEIVAHIGEGGMGLVYRARDTKLNRDVALKVLPDAFASDADRLARFTREAQTLAALNHPNIAHVHGLEESGGVRALVMELVEGDDLSQRIARGAIAVDEALPVARQIAEALEGAHQQGIIHRDLKPANIKLRPDGTVKVLDFGLAKALAPEQDPASGAHRSQSPTITSPAMLTGLGIVLGTAAYMAPEQAKGRDADKRSDIWAFGCVLFEMLTGRRPFDGEDMTDVLGAVVRLEPAWEALPSDLPAPVRTLLQADSSAAYASGRVFFARDQTLMAQAFDPDARQLAGDAVPVMARLSTEGSRYVSASISETGTLVYAPGGSLGPLQLTWFDRAGKILGTLGEGGIDVNPSLSPDQRQVAVALRSGSPENLDIWTIDITRTSRSRLTFDAEPEGWPVWSPRGTSIVFGSGLLGGGLPGKARLLLQTLANGSRATETLLEAVGTPSRPCAPRQCALAPTDWSADGRYVLYTFNGSFPPTADIWALPLFGDRKPFPVMQTEFSEGLGAFSPDGRWIAYTTNETGQPNVYVQPFLRAGQKYPVSTNGGRNPHWRADGRELFYLAADGAMTAVPIEATDAFAAGLPKTLFPAGVVSANQAYAVTKDGQRFLVSTRPHSADTAPPLTVIVNWTSTLQK